MCKIMEDYGDKRAMESEKRKATEIALTMIEDGTLSFEKIAELTKLPLEEVKALAENQSA